MLAALLRFTYPTWFRFWCPGSLVKRKWCHYIIVESVILFKLLPTSILDIFNVFEHIDMLVKHMVVPLLSYTHLNWLRFWWSGSLVEWKWCHYIMVEAVTLFKLLPTSILDIYKVFDHIDKYAVRRHMVATLLSYTHPTKGIFWWSGSPEEWKQCHYIMVEAAILFKLLPTSIWDIYKVFEYINMYAVHRHMVATLLRYTHPTWLRFLWSGSLVESKWRHYIMVDAALLFKLLLTSMSHVYKCMRILICCP